MYDSHLNFLSSSKRSLLVRMMYLQFGKGVLEIFLCVVSLVCIILLGGQWVMQMYFNTLSTNLTNTANQHAETSRQIHLINTIIKKTDQIQANYTIWTPQLVALFSAIPANITLDTATFDKPSKTYVITGTIQSRDDLLLLQNKLKDLSFVSSVDIPTSLLTFRENFPFSLSIKIK